MMYGTFVMHYHTYYLLPKPFTPDILLPNKSLTQCVHIISGFETSQTDRFQFHVAVTMKRLCGLVHTTQNTVLLPWNLGKCWENGVAELSPKL